MSYSTVEEASSFELRFWLQILGDHARFIRDSLAVEEREEIGRAEMFVQAALRITCSSGYHPPCVFLIFAQKHLEIRQLCL